jgi:hypothetical protein
MNDGSPLTEKAIAAIRQCGPGFAPVRGKTWPTKEAAVQAARDIGVEVVEEAS